VSQSSLDQARAVLQLKQRQRDELKVRAGLAGMLQLVPVDVGQQVAPGTNLARVATRRTSRRKSRSPRRRPRT
jgi:HlyD family secretion protein